MSKSRVKWCVGASVGLAAFLFANTALAEDEWRQWSLSTGVDYSSGDYGNAVNTSILYVPITAGYETRRFRLRATIPYLQIEGPGTVVGAGDGGVIIGPGGGPLVSDIGIGDMVVAGTVGFYAPKSSDRPSFELTAKVKIPTADATRGLGTGKADFTIQGDVFKSFGKVTPFATLGYRLRGDPAAFNLKNSVLLSGGVTVKVSDDFSVGGVIDYRSAASDFSDDVTEFSPYVVLKPNKDWAITVYALFGFTDASPDAGGGLMIKRKF